MVDDQNRIGQDLYLPYSEAINYLPPESSCKNTPSQKKCCYSSVQAIFRSYSALIITKAKTYNSGF